MWDAQVDCIVSCYMCQLYMGQIKVFKEVLKILKIFKNQSSLATRSVAPKWKLLTESKPQLMLDYETILNVNALKDLSSFDLPPSPSTGVA